MGCWGIGGQWGPVEEKQAVDTIHAALDAGVNLFDSADAYGMGQSEVYTGKALKGVRSDVYIDRYQCHVGSPERPEIFVEALDAEGARVGCRPGPAAPAGPAARSRQTRAPKGARHDGEQPVRSVEGAGRVHVDRDGH